MLAQERTRNVNDIVTAVIQKGNVTFELGRIKKYELGLPACSIAVYSADGEGTLVEIGEDTGATSFPAYVKDESKSLRTIYRGGRAGLDEVALQIVYPPDVDSLSSVSAESLQRWRDGNHGTQLRTMDAEKFDQLVQYASRLLSEMSH